MTAERGKEVREQRDRRREVAAGAGRQAAARERLDRGRHAVHVDIAFEAVATERRTAEGQVRLPRAADVVVADHVVAREPEVVVEVRQQRDAVHGAVEDHVALDDVVLAPADQDPGPDSTKISYRYAVRDVTWRHAKGEDRIPGTVRTRVIFTGPPTDQNTSITENAEISGSSGGMYL